MGGKQKVGRDRIKVRDGLGIQQYRSISKFPEECSGGIGGVVISISFGGGGGWRLVVSWARLRVVASACRWFGKWAGGDPQILGTAFPSIEDTSYLIGQEISLNNA